jgi:hypothetical protein
MRKLLRPRRDGSANLKRRMYPPNRSDAAHVHSHSTGALRAYLGGWACI